MALSAIRRFAASAAVAAGVSGCEMTVRFVSVREMTELNARFRGKKGPTDVLSFPAGEGAQSYLGDIAICPGAASARPSRLSGELKVLVLHGMLHLMGYDHEVDQGQMRRLEQRLRRKLGLR